MNVPIHRLRSKSRSDRLLQLTRLVGGANLDHTVTLLLVPSSLNVFTKVQCQNILMATFTFIKQTGRRL